MINTLKKILGIGRETDFVELIKNGAIIVDVRGADEYAAGHISNSKNIPVDKLKDRIHLLKDKYRPIITCCASGMHSGMAKNILLSNGYINVYNSGNWQNLQKKLE